MILEGMVSAGNRRSWAKISAVRLQAVGVIAATVQVLEDRGSPASAQVAAKAVHRRGGRPPVPAGVHAKRCEPIQNMNGLAATADPAARAVGDG